LVAGVGVWSNFQIFYYLLPVGIFLLLAGGKAFRRLPVIVLGEVLGYSPLLAYNISRVWATFQAFLGPAMEKNYAEIVGKNLIGTGLPHILGSRVRWEPMTSFVPEPLPQIVGAIFGLALLALLVQVGRSLLPAGRLERLRKSPEAFLLLFFMSVLFFYVRTDSGGYFPRYLYSAWGMINVLLGWWIVCRLRQSPALAALLFVPLAAQNVIGNAKVDPFYFSQPVHSVMSGQFFPRSNSKLLAYLNQNGLTRLHCDYWIGYSLAHESGEAVVCDVGGDRYAGYREAFLESPRPAYLFHVKQLRLAFYRNLFVDRLGYQSKAFLPYVVFSPREDFIPRAEWRVRASHNEQDAHRAVDGDLSSIYQWSAWIDCGEAWLEIDLGQERSLERVLLSQLWLSRDGRNWHEQPAAAVDPQRRIDEFDFPRQPVRYLKIVNRPEQFPYLWTVYDTFVR